MTTLVVIIHFILVLILVIGLIIITAIATLLGVGEGGLWSGALTWSSVLGTTVLVGEKLRELTTAGVDEPVRDLVCDMLVM